MARALSISSTENSSSSLKPAGAIALPVAVETAARVVSVADELRVLINHPGITLTTHLRVLPSLGIEELPALPLVSAGAASCGDELLVTGADAAGRPVVIGVAVDGQVAWQVQIDGASPARWPIPGCAPEPVIAWQKSLDKLEVANCVGGGLDNIRSISVGGPPLDVAIGESGVWAAWATASETQVVEISQRGVQSISIPSKFPSGVAVGACGDESCVAWTEDNADYFARIGSGVVKPSIALDLPEAGECKLAIVSGSEPLVWATRTETAEGENELLWKSALVLPGESPVMIEGFVHAVGWWGDLIAVVGWEEIRFLESAKRTKE